MKKFIFALVVILSSILHARDAYLGIYIVAPTNAELRASRLNFGIKIDTVMPGSPADISGFVADDIIFKINTTNIRHEGDLQRFMSRASSDDVITVHVSHNNQQMERSVQLATWDSLYKFLYIYNYIKNPWLFIGMLVEPITSSLARLLNLEIGMVILDIRENSIADIQGLESGDIIISVNEQQTFNERTLTDALNMGLQSQPMNIVIWRNNQTMSKYIDLSNNLSDMNNNSDYIFIVSPNVYDQELYQYQRDKIRQLLDKTPSELESDIERLEYEIYRLRQRMEGG